MSVVFINLSEVPVGRDETFRGLWQQVNDYMRTKPGYQAHRLHRTVADDARYRYANIAIWESAEAWRAASHMPHRDQQQSRTTPVVG